MKKNILIVLIGIALCISNSFGHEILSLLNTKWTIESNWDGEIYRSQVEFKKEGQLIYTDDSGDEFNGTWEQNAEEVIFSINEYSVFTGKIRDNNIIEGTSTNVNNEFGEFIMRKNAPI